jgi:hypothetical protein
LFQNEKMPSTRGDNSRIPRPPSGGDGGAAAAAPAAAAARKQPLGERAGAANNSNSGARAGRAAAAAAGKPAPPPPAAGSRKRAPTSVSASIEQLMPEAKRLPGRAGGAAAVISGAALSASAAAQQARAQAATAGPGGPAPGDEPWADMAARTGLTVEEVLERRLAFRKNTLAAKKLEEMGPFIKELR